MDKQRLRLAPMTSEELRMYADDPAALSVKYGLSTCVAQPEFFKTILRKQADRIDEHPESLRWLTFWLLIDEEEKVIVGSIDYKDIPDASGTVEIGYGIDEPYRNIGYATEAVRLMVEQAFSSGRVERVVAETEDGNPASDRVLLKSGFRLYDKKGISNWYERLRVR
ncbi:MAG TPA: hypothetical protein DCR44_00595 [Acholeplasmatales bacterium]|nr:hypothetical protein [Acholeplasmatales bacterium]